MDTYQTNVVGSISILEAIRSLKMQPRVLVAGSSAEYADPPDGHPIREDDPARANSPYGASKLAADQLAQLYVRRYELDRVYQNPFELLSGGQQARFQIMLMEADSPTMLLLDEPTDNLDVASADALQSALERYEGTVMAVTHDRWLMRTLDRFLLFDEDGTVHELLSSPFDVAVRRRGRRPEPSLRLG